MSEGCLDRSKTQLRFHPGISFLQRLRREKASRIRALEPRLSSYKFRGYLKATAEKVVSFDRQVQVLRYKTYDINYLLVTDPAAALSSIMAFLSLDTEPIMARTTGWSKIPGGPSGEWKATS